MSGTAPYRTIPHSELGRFVRRELEASPDGLTLRELTTRTVRAHVIPVAEAIRTYDQIMHERRRREGRVAREAVSDEFTRIRRGVGHRISGVLCAGRDYYLSNGKWSYLPPGAKS